MPQAPKPQAVRARGAFEQPLLVQIFRNLSFSPETKLSHLSAHVVNQLFHENRKTIPKILSGKKLLKNVTLQVLNFIPVS